MTEQSKKITPSDLLSLDGFIADASSELSRGLAFLNAAQRALPMSLTPQIEVQSVLIKKALEHLGIVNSMMAAIPESFEAASILCHSGEPFEVEDLFTKEEEEGR